MKKRLILATVIVLLLAIGLTLFVGCDEIFTRNDERDMTQVVAKVTYHNETTEIYKFELRSSFNSYAYVYINYYGMSAEAAANYILQSLAQQKLMVLYAREQVCQMDRGSVPAELPAAKDLLNPAEQNKAIKDANDSLLSSLKSLVEDAITEDNYNNASVDGGSSDKTDDDEEEEITDPVNVRFESNGGTEIERQRIQKGKTAEEPDDPTKDGYTFYGWYDNKDFDGEEFKFDTQINNTVTLYAKWVEYTAPRTALPEEEEDEEEEFDPDATLEEADKAEPFFGWTADKLYDEIKEEDFVEDIELADGEDIKTVLGKYISDALADLKQNLRNNLYKKSADSDKDVQDIWEYYLNSQYETLIVDRFERLLGNKVTVSQEEIQKEYDRLVRQNKESFQLSDSAYSSALGSSLNSTYYHPIEDADHSYGFVTNILLRLDEESLAKLTDQLSANPANKEAARVMRNQYLSELKVKVSNPKYDADATVEKDGKEFELRDPMTDPKNPYGYLGMPEGTEYDKTYEFKTGENTYENNYNALLSFGKKKDADGNETEEYEIKFQATEHPAMAYLLKEVPAFDQGDQIGVIHQIYNSFEQVKQAGLDKVTEVYWLRKMASTWAYLVGDDTGAVTSSSNNNGLGYLITPEGEESSYLKDFTSFARELIKQGTGAYAVGDIDVAKDFLGASDSKGTIAGDGKAFVIADSFIESGSTSNGYAGIFVLLNTYTVWDSALYGAYTDGAALPEDHVLPGDFVFDFALDAEDRKTIFDGIKENLETAKKTAAYNLDVNKMGTENEDSIEYFEKAYRSLWKSYE